MQKLLKIKRKWQDGCSQSGKRFPTEDGVGHGSQIPDRNCQMAVESQLRPMLQHAHIGSKGGEPPFAANARVMLQRVKAAIHQPKNAIPEHSALGGPTLGSDQLKPRVSLKLGKS